MGKISVGLGWDRVPNQEVTTDCDLSAFLLIDNKLNKDKDVVCWLHPSHYSHAVELLGDNLTGDDTFSVDAKVDETIELDLSALSAQCPQYNKIIFTVSIYAAKERGLTFGQIPNAFFSVRNQETGENLCYFDLTHEFPDDMAAKVFRFYKERDEWKFRPDRKPISAEDGKISQVGKALMGFKKP